MENQPHFNFIAPGRYNTAAIAGVTALGIAGGILLDRRAELHQEEALSTNPVWRLETNPHSDELVVAIPGCNTSSKEFINDVTEQLSPRVNVLAFGNPDIGYDKDKYLDSIVDQLSRNQSFEKIHMYAQSMGGQLVYKLLSERHEQLEDNNISIDTVVFDSSPGSKEDVSKKWIASLIGASVTSNSWVANRVKTVYESKHNMTATNIKTLHQQGRFIKENPVQPGKLVNHAKRFVYTCAPKTSDPVINTATASGKYYLATSGQMELVINRDAPEGSHAHCRKDGKFLLDIIGNWVDTGINRDYAAAS